MNILMPVSSKGGVGKTFTCFCFAYYWEQLKLDFAVLDFDWNSNALYRAYSTLDRGYRLSPDFESALSECYNFFLQLPYSNLIINCPGNFLGRFQNNILASLLAVLSEKQGYIYFTYVVSPGDCLSDFKQWYECFSSSNLIKEIFLVRGGHFGHDCGQDIEMYLSNSGIHYILVETPKINVTLIPLFYNSPVPLDKVESIGNSLVRSGLLIYRANLYKVFSDRLGGLWGQIS